VYNSYYNNILLVFLLLCKVNHAVPQFRATLDITCGLPVFCIGMTSSAEAVEDDVVDDQRSVISLEGVLPTLKE
jgi:hypothetical protein